MGRRRWRARVGDDARRVASGEWQVASGGCDCSVQADACVCNISLHSKSARSVFLLVFFLVSFYRFFFRLSEVTNVPNLCAFSGCTMTAPSAAGGGRGRGRGSGRAAGSNVFLFQGRSLFGLLKLYAPRAATPPLPP